MGKHPSILNAYLPVECATTAPPALIPQSITLDLTLVRKTRWIVLEDKGKLLTASVFRESSSEPGCFSRDVYLWTGRKWGRPRKDRYKYRKVPAPPPGAYPTNLNDIEFWTKGVPMETEIERLRSLIGVLSPPSPLKNFVSIVYHSVIR